MELLIRNAAYRRKKTNETLYLSSGARWGTNHSKSNNGKGNGRVALKTTGRNQNSRAGRPGACPAPVLLSGHTSRAERTRGSPRLPPYGIVAEAEDNPINPNYVVRVFLPFPVERWRNRSRPHITVSQILWGKSKPEHVNKISCFITSHYIATHEPAT